MLLKAVGAHIRLHKEAMALDTKMQESGDYSHMGKLIDLGNEIALALDLLESLYDEQSAALV